MSTVLVGAGDIANCGGKELETARLLDNITGTVFTLGDNAYPDGTDLQSITLPNKAALDSER